jgi:hypothetical protein
MSDRVPGATTLEERIDDIRAVMDAAGSERSAVLGESEGGPLSMLFAAAHPERTVALILQGAEVRELRDEEWPWGEGTAEELEEYLERLPERTVDDRVCHVENARFLARTIPRPKYVELPGADHVPWFDPDETLAEIREFLTGRREAATADRMLATVLFTDLVGSTAQATELGDRKWRGLLELEVEVLEGKVTGIAVNIGARVAARAGAGEVLVSGTVKDLVAGSGLTFEDRGSAELKGVPAEWRLYAVST